MSTKRHVLIVTLAVCAAVLVAPLSHAGGSTAGEPESSDMHVWVDPAPPIAWSASTDPSGDVEQVEPPAEVTDTAESATEDVAEEPDPSEQTVVARPRCMLLTKRDYIVPPATGDEDVTEVPDPEPEVATAPDEPSADADDADADGLGADEPAAVDEGAIPDEPAETTDADAELAGL